MVHTHHAPVCVEIFAGMFDKGETQAGLQPYIVAFNLRNAGIMTQGGETVGCEGHANRITLVTAGVVETLIVPGLMGDTTVGCSMFLPILWVSKGVVPLHLPRSTNLFAVTQALQARPGLIATAHGPVQYLVGTDLVLFERAFIVFIGSCCPSADLSQRQ
ncbi:hypothetical protein D3C80_1246640 [compost metagenome]